MTRARTRTTAFLFGLLLLGAGATLPACKRNNPAAPGTAAGWTCPMHPEVKSAQEGTCPKCRMDLVPMKEDAAAKPDGGSQK